MAFSGDPIHEGILPFFNEEHMQIKEMARDFAEGELKPRAAEIDETGIFPAAIFSQMGELGFFGLAYPEQYGGAGLDQVSYIIGVEEIHRVCASTGISYAAHVSLSCYPMFAFGNDEQKAKYLPDMLSGKKIGVFGLTEPGAGSDAGGTRTVAVKDGDEWVINGVKNFITNAGDAKIAIVLAVTDEEKRTRGGMTNFIIDVDTPGFKIGKHENKMGLRGSTTCELILEDVRVKDSAILGKPGEGFKQFMKVLDGGRISIGAGALGIAQGAYEEAVKYSGEREQFGRPINAFQAVQFKLADMGTEIHAARQMVYDAALRYDRGLDYSKSSAMCKLYASEVANRVVDQAVQVHGGYGYIKEFPVERMYRDQKLYEIGEGTSEIQRMVISRFITKSKKK